MINENRHKNRQKAFLNKTFIQLILCKGLRCKEVLIIFAANWTTCKQFEEIFSQLWSELVDTCHALAEHVFQNFSKNSSGYDKSVN